MLRFIEFDLCRLPLAFSDRVNQQVLRDPPQITCWIFKLVTLIARQSSGKDILHEILRYLRAGFPVEVALQPWLLFAVDFVEKTIARGLENLPISGRGHVGTEAGTFRDDRQSHRRTSESRLCRSCTCA